MEGYLPHRLENESVPFPLLYAAKSSKDRSSKIKSIIDSPSITPSDVEELLIICIEANAFTHLRKVVNQEAEKAHYLLDSLKPTRAKDLLKSIVKQYTMRKCIRIMPIAICFCPIEISKNRKNNKTS